MDPHLDPRCKYEAKQKWLFIVQNTICALQNEFRSFIYNYYQMEEYFLGRQKLNRPIELRPNELLTFAGAQIYTKLKLENKSSLCVMHLYSWLTLLIHSL